MLILSSRQSARGQSGDAPLSLSPYALRNNDGTVDVQSPYPSIIIRKEIANVIRILQLGSVWLEGCGRMEPFHSSFASVWLDFVAPRCSV